MPAIKTLTLNNIEDLKSSGYGRPWPRHGLHLLHWFSNEYVRFNNYGDMVVGQHPKDNIYGFHHFANHPQHDGKRLLPYQNMPCYEVGNLFGPEAKKLPEYVRSNIREDKTLSNIDRLIISIHPDWTVDKIYVTKHNGEVSFDPQNTFQISKDLVKIISNQDLEKDLLKQVGYINHRRTSFVPTINLQSLQHPSPGASLSPPAWVNLTSEGYYRQPMNGRDVNRRLDDSRPGRTCNCIIL